ncbi:uncharacterized protein LOC131936089 [Physella acuta]|uniref:uncharacterized protein LOC131936089 n=1 Tax=Physella acuta TaxID=109671 RepID=UPI0027DBA503|nr:uncharacterized protein LOC131936089 [Physella acuta]
MFSSTPTQGEKDMESLHTAKVYQRLTVSLSVLVGILIVTAVCIAYVFHAELSMSQEKPLACIDCKKLKQYFNSEVLQWSLTRERGADGVEKCCAYNHQQMSAIIDMNIESRQTSKDHVSDINKELFFLSPVTVHRRLYQPKVKALDPTEPTAGNLKATLLLQHQNSTPDPLVEHSRGVEVLSDGIKILHPGLYYIYSSLDFQPQTKVTCKQLNYQFSAIHLDPLPLWLDFRRSAPSIPCSHPFNDSLPSLSFSLLAQ